MALDATSVTVYVPGVVHVTVGGFCKADEDGVPLGNVHVHEVAFTVVWLVNVIGVDGHTACDEAANNATGGAAEGSTHAFEVVKVTYGDGLLMTASIRAFCPLVNMNMHASST